MSVDPMLDGITRWDSVYDPAYGDHILKEHDAGRFIKFSDLPALLAAAREDERGKSLAEGWEAGFDYAWPRGMQAMRDEVTYAETDAAYAKGQRDEREKWSVLIKDRIRDLQSCTKHDDCMGKADILLVILDDYDYGVAREEKS